MGREEPSKVSPSRSTERRTLESLFRTSRCRSDTSFMLAKQRLSSFGAGEHTTNAETMDDDLAPLLPSKRELSQEDIYQVSCRDGLFS